jgi:hypothetical protein
VPEHCLALGVHSPAHSPVLLSQVYVQAVPEFQVPVESHVCDVLLEQRVRVGTQLPEHAPPLHTYEHAVPDVGHFPVESQVRAVLPSQDFSTLGLQTAPHCPLVMVPLSQVPWPLHVCGVVPEQLVELGEQTPVHAPFTHAWFVHETGGPHIPEELHV